MQVYRAPGYIRTTPKIKAGLIYRCGECYTAAKLLQVRNKTGVPARQ